VVGRDADIVAALGRQTVDVVIDSVAGPAFGGLVELLRSGGRYATSGAIAGPIVTFDTRLLYLRDLTFIGATAWAEPVFPALIGYIERGLLHPVIAASFQLEQIADAQRAFLAKRHVGKLVLVPPPQS
jgi:NADPH:quinone reductase-like Zn-dependent oxidoreductase